MTHLQMQSDATSVDLTAAQNKCDLLQQSVPSRALFYFTIFCNVFSVPSVL